MKIGLTNLEEEPLVSEIVAMGAEIERWAAIVEREILDIVLGRIKI